MVDQITDLFHTTHKVKTLVLDLRIALSDTGELLTLVLMDIYVVLMI